MRPRVLEERVFCGLMLLSTLLVVGSLVVVIATIIARGGRALSLAMVTQTSSGGYYYGKGGGVLNAIVGSLLLAGGATIVVIILALPVAFFLQQDYAGKSRFAAVVRTSLDLLWGIPSIVYGAFGFTVLLYLHMRACLEPILKRAFVVCWVLIAA
ncbi:MAG: phosphate ABC transporter permease, partial [Candidatus Zipacnadales bacterium]